MSRAWRYTKALAYAIHANGADNIRAKPLDGYPGYLITSLKSDRIYDFHWSPSGERGLVSIVAAQPQMSSSFARRILDSGNWAGLSILAAAAAC